MRTRNRQPYWLLWVALLGVFVTSCVTAGEAKESSSSVPLEDAMKATLKVKMERGTLTVQGGASDLVEGDFTYNAELQPEIKVNRSPGAVKAEINQEDAGPLTIGASDNEWLLRITDEIPVHLILDLSGADVDLQLDGVKLASLVVDTDDGDSDLDLTGADITEDVAVNAYSVSGDFEVRVPGDVGVQLNNANPGSHLGLSGFDFGSTYTIRNNVLIDGDPMLMLNLETRSGAIGVTRVESAVRQ